MGRTAEMKPSDVKFRPIEDEGKQSYKLPTNGFKPQEILTKLRIFKL